MINKRTIPIFWPYTGAKKRTLKLIKQTLDSRWWGQGPLVDKFEEEFSKKFGYKYPLFVNSGTSALELAYHIIGLKPGDEVIVPVLDCTAGQTGLLRRGVKIVFADINKEDLNISYEDVKRKITKKTKAIVGVALGGIPTDPRLSGLARKHSIKYIIDAAQHHEPTTLVADFVCYSFQAIKHITTCDGGMLCLKNNKDYKRAKLLRWFGIDRELKARKNYQAWERRQMTFDIEEAGYKYQPTDIDACFGLATLPDLDKVIQYHKDLAIRYIVGLSEVPEVTVIAGGSCWLVGILVEDRDKLAAHLHGLGIDNNMVHLRNDIFKIFGGKRLKLPNMDWVEPRYLYLPMNTMVSQNDVEYICQMIKEYYGRKA